MHTKHRGIDAMIGGPHSRSLQLARFEGTGETRIVNLWVSACAHVLGPGTEPLIMRLLVYTRVAAMAMIGHGCACVGIGQRCVTAGGWYQSTDSGNPPSSRSRAGQAWRHANRGVGEGHGGRSAQLRQRRGAAHSGALENIDVISRHRQL